MRHLAPILLLLCTASRAQVESLPVEPAPVEPGAPDATRSTEVPRRFDGWDLMRDPAFRFDPDERDVLGFSVPASPSARAALDAAESALAAGDLRTAARRFAGMVGAFGDEVLQVQGGRGRWVGAGEWALYELLTRLPESARATLTSAAEQREVEAAAHWRDLPALRRLAAGLDGQQPGRQAAALLARLLAERGQAGAARAAAERAGRPAPIPEPPTAAAPGLLLPEHLTESWRSSLVIDEIGVRNPFTPSSSPYGEAPIAPIIPVVSDNVAFVTDSISLRALDVFSGRTLWHHAGPLERVAAEGRASPSFGFNLYIDESRPDAVSPYQCLTPVLTDTLVIATEQMAEAYRKLQAFESIPINWPLPRRRLIALDRQTGEVVWQQERPEAGPDDFRNRFDVAGPPAVGDGMVCAAGSITEGSVNSYAAAFDERSGELLWRTLLCSGQQDLTMFNRPFKEHAASPPLLHDGALYMVSNLGVIASVDGFSGRLRWLTGYEPTPRRPSRSPERDQSRDVTFLNRPPLIEAGRLILAPLDGTHVLALDPRTGRQVWALDAQWSSLRGWRHDVLGSGDGRLFVMSDQSVECLDAATGALLWTSLLNLEGEDRLDGAASLVRRKLLLPALSGLIVLDIDAPEQPLVRNWQGTVAQRGVRRVVAAGAALLLTDNAQIFGVVDAPAALAQALAENDGSQAARLQVAELQLANGRLGEAAASFEAALAGADKGLAARARSGRLQAATRAALERDDVAGWQELLATAIRLGDPWVAAQKALPALAALGADEAVDAGLAALAELDGRRSLDLGRLSRDGSQPVALLLALRRLPRDTPAQAVARLQDLIVRWPDERWEGVPVRQAAAHRIAALLAEHGKGLYAPFERQAEEALAGSDEPASLAAVEASFPNAHAVVAARGAQLRQRLEDGYAREVFVELGVPGGGGADHALVALRAEAARQLGETVFADVLLGTPVSPAPAVLPALPGANADRVSYEISSRGRVSFPWVTGRFAAPFESCVLGAVNGPGELFLLDTTSGQTLWRREIPGKTSFASPGGVDFSTDGQRLFVQVYQRGAPAGGGPGDLVEAIALQDGATLWSAELPGEARASAVSSGLLLRLCGGTAPDTRRFRVDGYGVASGSQALSVDLPPSVDSRLYAAGPHVVVFTAGDLARNGAAIDSRLSVLDVRHGTLASSTPLSGEAPSVVLALDEPPLLLIAQNAGSGAGTTLAAWDPESLDVLWEADVPGAMVTRQNLYPAGEGRLLLFASASGSAAGQRDTTALLTPIDARSGPLPPTQTGVALLVLNGQALGLVPRLVLSNRADSSRLLVADGATAALRFEVGLPVATSSYSRVAHGRDGFLLVQELREEQSTTLRLFDAASGAERYSTVLSGLRAPGRPEVTLVEGAVLLASGGTVTVIRSPVR